jgi:uncharacterized protein (DUF488 family)
MPHAIATIGYEKATPDQVIAALKAARIDTLIDIRAVARSRRPGFSKGNLSAAVAAAGLGYLHLKGLGTPAEGREANKAGRMDDFEAIFRAQLATAEAQADLERAAALASSSRICLLCLEGDHRRCHRTIVADLLAERLGTAILHLAPFDGL